MKNALLVTAACFALSGCSHTTNRLEFVLTPNVADNSVTFECSHSSSGKCFIHFERTAAPARGNIPEGDTITFRDIAPETRYCVETTSSALQHCVPTSLPSRRQTVSRKTSMDAGA